MQWQRRRRLRRTGACPATRGQPPPRRCGPANRKLTWKTEQCARGEAALRYPPAPLLLVSCALDLAYGKRRVVKEMSGAAGHSLVAFFFMWRREGRHSAGSVHIEEEQRLQCLGHARRRRRAWATRKLYRAPPPPPPPPPAWHCCFYYRAQIICLRDSINMRWYVKGTSHRRTVRNWDSRRMSAGPSQHPRPPTPSCVACRVCACVGPPCRLHFNTAHRTVLLQKGMY